MSLFYGYSKFGNPQDIFSASHRGCISGSGTSQDTPGAGFCGWCWLETTGAVACSQPHVQPARRVGCCRVSLRRKAVFLASGVLFPVSGWVMWRQVSWLTARRFRPSFQGGDVLGDRLAVGLRLIVAGTAPDLPRGSLFGSGWGTVCETAFPEPGVCQSLRLAAMGGLSPGESGVVLRRSVIAVILVFA